MRFRLLPFAIGLLIGISPTLFKCSAARAHTADYGWEYPWACCSGNDCAQLPEGSVKTTPEGFDITLMPGQHPMVKDKPFRILVPYSDAKPAPNGDPYDHLCLSPQLKFLCMFAGNRGI